MDGLTAGLWSLDDRGNPQTQEVLKQADARPEDFVLKPQREGGGNNLYGEALQKRLEDPKGLAAYILMQRIRPPINRCPTAPALGSNTNMTISLHHCMFLRKCTGKCCR